MSTSIFRYENDYTVITFDFSTVLYFSYCKGTKWVTVHFFDTEKVSGFWMGYDDFLNLATRWKNWKNEMAETPQQYILA